MQESSAFDNLLVTNWWALAIRGVAALVFGILTFLWPGLTLVVLVALFGAYALVDGIFAIISAVRRARSERRWWPLLLQGLAGIAAGVITFLWPAITALALLYLIAAWAIVTGLFQIGAAIRLRQQITGEWLLALSGVLSILFGILLVLWPAPGALALIWLIGGYAIAFGILLLVLALRLRQRGTEPASRAQERAMPSTASRGESPRAR